MVLDGRPAAVTGLAFAGGPDCGLALKELSEADTVEDGYGLTVGDH
ncbi:hypothetical protein [Streptosporangium pseudovulgare]|uniref:Uncharacterized protein n=1 Tax=Streptosporangium pseudovulgare TaxID=35765 RepID=A0ABQ2RIS0_9ACTN|nr:hypothetical protein [Streptosporangium pseudovulgare]GGQ34504.1 hypothetical protein GCM10010140_75590 [Streptosporangium pseudovulgare]